MTAIRNRFGWPGAGLVLMLVIALCLPFFSACSGKPEKKTVREKLQQGSL